jgi:glycosyltransferase involved in cell wall biosynthesis
VLQNETRKRLSVCMIVRNEAHVLPRCIGSLGDTFDELCIVDTGSSDMTVEVAKQLGAQVRHFDACNYPDGSIRDFSLARNIALDMAQGEWILSIDADEVLTEGGAHALTRALYSSRAAALQVTLRDEGVQWRTPRLFKNLPTHRFIGRVHEQVAIRGTIENAEGVILDHMPDKRGKESSHDRNLRLCEAEVRDNPADARALHYLATELRNAKRYEEAILRYTQQLALGVGWPTERYQACLGIASCCYESGDFVAAVSACMRALAIDPRYAEVHCLIADAYRALGNPAFAVHWYRSALACGAPPPGSPTLIITEAYSSYPRAQLAECERELSEATLAPYRRAQ